MISGVIGAAALSPKVESKLNSLAMLLENEDSFQDIFAVKHADKKKEDRPKAGKKVTQIESLLAQSRQFVLKGQEHNYVDSDQIFYIREATNDRRQTKECVSCLGTFATAKEMCFCQFCGYANCKDCLKKTRCFYEEK